MWYLFKETHCTFLLFIFGHMVFGAAHGFSLVGRAGATLHCGFSLQWLLSLWIMGSRVLRLHALQYLDSVVMAHGPLWRVKSSWTRDRACVPCIRRQVLIHCSPREVRDVLFFNTGWAWKSSLIRETL